LETLLIGILKHVFCISVKDLAYCCFKALHINFGKKRSLTSPVFADSQSKMLSKCLHFYLKYLKQNFITNMKHPRIAAAVGNVLTELVLVL